jgi:CBS domain containing-hemolysin-like protein
MALLIAYVALALGISFLCSVLEAVLLSITPGYVANMQTSRPVVGERIAAMKDDIEQPLAAILSLNTVAHTVGAAGAGAQALKVFGNEYVAWASAALTLAILFVSEIVPKTVGALYWKKLAPAAVRVLRVMVFLMYPLVLTSRGLSRILTRGRDPAPTVTRPELTALADLVKREGVVDETEARVFKSLLRFRSLRAQDIMTPRSVLIAFDESTTVAAALADEERLIFSRIPIYSGSIEHITGYVLKHDLMLAVARDEEDKPLSELRRRIIAMSEEVALPDLLDVMISNREHIVVLREALGGTAGIATLEDVVETLLGMEIVDETDVAIDMRAHARERWRQRAQALGLPVDSEDPEGGELPVPGDDP